MALRGIFASFQVFVKHYRSLSTYQRFLDVSLDDENGVATVTMNRPPVNGLNLDLVKEFNTVIPSLEQQRVSGIIITSSSDKIFSAGFDLNEIYKPDQERLKIYWKSLQDLWLTLYTSPVTTAALITGHAPAGGCFVAMCCDYRVMVNNFTIGLTEARLGIPIPFWTTLNLANIIGHRKAELAVIVGRAFTTEEALKDGLVDEIGSDRANALKKVLNFFKRFDGVNPAAKSLTKQDLRSHDAEIMKGVREEELEVTMRYLTQPEFQGYLGKYIGKLKKK